MKTKKIVNYLVTTVIVYCFSIWVLACLFYVIQIDFQENIRTIALSSFIFSLCISYLIDSLTKSEKLIMEVEYTPALVKKLDHSAKDLGYDRASFSEYIKSPWYCFMQSKLEVEFENKTAIISGPKQDLEKLYYYLKY